MEANHRIQDVVVNIDLAPTIVEMAGSTLNSVDGVSFLPAIIRNKRKQDFVESNDINSNYSPHVVGKS